MRRTIVVAVLTSLVAGWASTAPAVFVESRASYAQRGHHRSWFSATKEYVRRGYRRNADWPWPHTCPDRLATREPFDIMIRNGWRRQNLLGDHYFEPGTNRLNIAGELHVRWVMTQAPPARRQLFIAQSIDPNITAARVAEVRSYATRVTLDGQTPPVLEVSLMAEGRPAAMVDWTAAQFMENMVPPVLPAAASSSLSP